MVRTRSLVISVVLIIVCVSIMGAVFLFNNRSIPHFEYGETGVPKLVTQTPATIFFVGDVMLGRRVETLSLEYGLLYPFESATFILAGADMTVGNLEGPVPVDHVHTPDLTYLFSFHERVLPVLKTVGFDMLSLANNHAGDHGTDDLLHTRGACDRVALSCVGDPDVLSTTSIAFRTINNERVGFLMIHATVPPLDIRVLDELLTTLRTESDTQIAYIHWGEEYSLEHTPAQQVLAELLIDGGIDAVVGHHPHVVQDIGLYKGKPIFYSLGNFIFDQYFSDDVQEGLGVHMEIQTDIIMYTLVGFESKSIRSQPQLLGDDDAERLLERILTPIKEREEVNVGVGVIRAPR